MKRELAERQPEIVTAVYQGFKDACEEAIVKGMTSDTMTTMIPWLTALVTDNRKGLGDDRWP